METHDLPTNMMAKIPKIVSNCESSDRAHERCTIISWLRM
jgi:hypothetical protein